MHRISVRAPASCKTDQFCIKRRHTSSGVPPRFFPRTARLPQVPASTCRISGLLRPNPDKLPLTIQSKITDPYKTPFPADSSEQSCHMISDRHAGGGKGSRKVVYLPGGSALFQRRGPVIPFPPLCCFPRSDGFPRFEFPVICTEKRSRNIAPRWFRKACRRSNWGYRRRTDSPA